MLKKYQMGKILNQGGFALIYEIVGEPEHVMKIQPLRQDIHEIQLLLKEASIQSIISLWQQEHNLEIVPKYIESGFDYYHNQLCHIIVMLKYTGTLSQCLGFVNDFNNIPNAAYTAELTWTLRRKLAYLHKLGYVHRDIKPSNIFWRQDQSGNLILVYGDLGLARELTEKGRKKIMTI